MRISVNTETEELEELRHAVAIIEDAIKRRENPDSYEEEDYKEQADERDKTKEVEKKVEAEKPEFKQPSEPNRLTVEALKVEEATPQLEVKIPELNIPKMQSYAQVAQQNQAQKPVPIPSRMEERGNTPDIDISALSMSNYGEAREGRKMDNMARPSSSSPSFSSPSQPSSILQPRGFEPRLNNESAVKEIINSLRNQKSGQPIQMSEIIGKARTRNISEQETRNLVSKLQREGSI